MVPSTDTSTRASGDEAQHTMQGGHGDPERIERNFSSKGRSRRRAVYGREFLTPTGDTPANCTRKSLPDPVTRISDDTKSLSFIASVEAVVGNDEDTHFEDTSDVDVSVQQGGSPHVDGADSNLEEDEMSEAFEDQLRKHAGKNLDETDEIDLNGNSVAVSGRLRKKYAVASLLRDANEEERLPEGSVHGNFKVNNPSGQIRISDSRMTAETENLGESNRTEAQSPLSRQPNREELVQAIDQIFKHSDPTTTTVSDVVKSLESRFGAVKLTKETRKSFVRNRLSELMNGQVGCRESLDHPAESARQWNSDEDESAPSADEGNEGLPEDSESLSQKYSNRRRTGAMSRVRKHAKNLRERQIGDAKVREEELRGAGEENDGNAADRNDDGQKINRDQDRIRAEQIAAKFQTDNDEARMRRIKDRSNLLQKLSVKRMNVIRLTPWNPNGKGEEVVRKEPERLGISSAMGKLAAAMTMEDHDGEDVDLEIVPSSACAPDLGDRALLQENGEAKHSSVWNGRRNGTVDDILMGNLNAKARRSLAKTRVESSMQKRKALMCRLRIRQVKAGNRWLARELGYNTEEEHLRDCWTLEERKRKQIARLEEQRRMNRPAAFDLLAEEETSYVEEQESVEASGNDEVSLVERTVGEPSEEERMEEGEENERNKDDNVGDDEGTSLLGWAKDSKNSQSSEDGGDVRPCNPMKSDVPTNEGDHDAATPQQNRVRAQVEKSDAKRDLESSVAMDAKSIADSAVAQVQEIVNGDSAANVVSNEKQREGSLRDDSKPRNTAWKALLEKEAKRNTEAKRSNLVESEAVEEEEEAAAGLEDFGFTVKKDKEDDEEEAKGTTIQAEDIDNVVDDLSDGEGDEEAGDEARKALEAKEEKERHREIMRRMREGYDGRRGGVASGGGARGMHRFDQLVAAGNRDHAKSLGLLCDDEMDSDGEEAKAAKTIEEDETALLDKMLKDRFLNRESDVLEEEFSSDEEEGGGEEGPKGDGSDVDEEREQERLAKRFAKRARLNRLLESVEGETEYSQGRLIDEDKTLQHDLEAIKSTRSRKQGHLLRRSSSVMSRSSSEGGSHLVQTPISEEDVATSQDAGTKTTNVVPLGSIGKQRSVSGGLSLAMHRSISRPSSMGMKRSLMRLHSTSEVISSSARTLATGHVIFDHRDSGCSRPQHEEGSHIHSQATSSRPRKIPSGGALKRASSLSAATRGGSSLWMQVCSDSFRQKRRRTTTA